MASQKKRQQRKPLIKMCALLLGLCLTLALGSGIAAAEVTLSDNQLKNGSFEDGPAFDRTYSQPYQNEVPAWNTTAFQGKIELFKANSTTYFENILLKPTDGTYAAELNADEESTLYQNVKTTPSSVYEWGLDHGARNGTDIMALVIGPKQSVDPSKPSKDGRDQFMQMVDWLNSDENPTIQAEISAITAGATPLQYTVYSKKFAASGAFEDNAGNNAFSLTPSTIYTEEWHIWIMASSKATSGTNPWNSYGSNSEGSAGSGSSGGTAVDLSKYYLYTVPAGQTETLFGFVSVGYQDSTTTPDKAKTYGNFLDNINFKLYHPLNGSASTHGSAVIGGSDGTEEGVGATEGHTITVDSELAIYITNGETLKIQAIVKKADSDAGCEFVGLYYTKQGTSGTSDTTFLRLAGNEIEDTGSLTDEQKKGKWIKSTNAAGDTVYTYYLENLTSPIDLHFVFIKSPTITYDPNGGKAYVVERTYNTDEAANVYSYKPHLEGTYTFIAPYVSHAAVGKEDGWKFMGWLLTGDTVGGVSADIQVNADQLGSLLLPAEHTVACDYAFDGVNEDSKAQYFKIYSEQKALTGTQTTDTGSGEVTGVIWTGAGDPAYANVHKGLTMVAQWRWRQAFIPQVGSGSSYVNSAAGGTVQITSVTDSSDPNYISSHETYGQAYFADADERVTVEAAANTGYTFEGWYDASGNLITTNTDYTYTVTKESVNTYYARFSGSVTQTYIRQVWNGTGWIDIGEAETSAVGTLGRYTYTDAAGKPISSTAAAGSGYYFVGWYDDAGNAVDNTMLDNGGATISYITTGSHTYYARFRAIAYKVTYDVNGGSGSISDSGTYYHSAAGGSSTIPVGAAPTREHYTFSGWELVGSGNVFASGSTIDVDAYCSNAAVIGDVTDGQGDFKLKAKWTPDLYTIVYDLAGGTLAAGESNPGSYNIESASFTLHNPTRTGYTFAGWTGTGLSGQPDAVTIPTGSTGNRSYTAVWTANTGTAYTVEHYKQNLNDDNYTIVTADTESLQGTTGEQTAATAKTYTGFTAQTITQKTIAGDGSTVVQVYYDRSTYTVTYDYGTAPAGASAQPAGSTYKYGKTVTVASAAAAPGYTFSGWTTTDATVSGGMFTMPAKNVVLRGSFSANDNTPYKVEHYQQNLNDDGYTIVTADTESLQGTTGEQTAATAKTYTGFTAQTITQETIAGDGSTVVQVYYDRSTYTIAVTVTGGTANAGPSIPVMYGGDKTIMFTANPNCVLDSVTVNGVAASLTGGEYTFTDVAENQTIEVVYKRDVKGAPDSGGAEHGDGIPDEYQVFVRYEAGANGSLTGETYQAFDLRQPPLNTLRTSVDLTFPAPSAGSGYRFSSWANPADVTVAGSTMSGLTPGETYTFTANFAVNYIPPVVNPDPGLDAEPPFTVRGLNTVDHVAYIIGVGGDRVDPLGAITRAEIANIFFRLMTDEFRNANWSTDNRFNDVADDMWYSMAVLNLDKAGIIIDSDDGNFRPYDPITRAELAAMAAQFCTITGRIPVASFEDVPVGYWAANEIALIEYAGWIEGYEGKFYPDENLSRAEAVTIVNRMLHRGAEDENMLPGMLTWVDNANPDVWYYGAIQEATNAHDYTRTNVLLTGEQFRGDRWTALLEAADWAAMERAWISANSK